VQPPDASLAGRKPEQQDWRPARSWWRRLTGRRKQAPAPAPAAPEPEIVSPAESRETAPDDPQNLLPTALATLAMRDLTLVDSLLAFVEQLERQEDDPEQLKVLFQIDHLATRMRRNGENLLILAGHGGQGKHTEPVPLLDVVRAAMSEVSEYTRVQLQDLPQDAAISPDAADDLSHLVAELLDNAIAFSAAKLPVVVRGRIGADGALLIEVVDDGIGIPAERLDQLNRWLATPPQLSEDVVRHMGLYVVSRLAARQNVSVQLQTRPFSGTTAYVRIPGELVTAVPPVPQTPRTPRPPAGTPALPPVGRRGPQPSPPAPTRTGASGLPRRESKRNRRTTPASPPPPAPPPPRQDKPVRPSAPAAGSGELWELPQRRRSSDAPPRRRAGVEGTAPEGGRGPRDASAGAFSGQPPGFAERIRADLEGLLSGQAEAAREIASRSQGNSTPGAERAMEK